MTRSGETSVVLCCMPEVTEVLPVLLMFVDERLEAIPPPGVKRDRVDWGPEHSWLCFCTEF